MLMYMLTDTFNSIQNRKILETISRPYFLEVANQSIIEVAIFFSSFFCKFLLY